MKSIREIEKRTKNEITVFLILTTLTALTLYSPPSPIFFIFGLALTLLFALVSAYEIGYYEALNFVKKQTKILNTNYTNNTESEERK